VCGAFRFLWHRNSGLGMRNLRLFGEDDPRLDSVAMLK
jgi:hypothetical protein